MATVAPDFAAAELSRLHAAGIRGARCHMLPNAFLSWYDVRTVAGRVAPLGWHLQLQLDGRDLPQYDSLLRGLPTDVLVDNPVSVYGF